MKKLLTMALACILLFSSVPALAQTVAPGGSVTVEFPFSGASIYLLEAEYTAAPGLAVTGGDVEAMYGGKAGKTRALFVNVPAISGGTLALKVTADATASGDLNVNVTKLRGYAPSSGWVDLTGAVTKTLTVQAASSDRIPGDADDNSMVDIDDALTVLQHLAGWGVAINLENADCDGIAGINIDDALQILQNLAGWGVALV
ncbi:MAG: hypothetical protein GXY67_08180 [Clostridiales bacterium]|nr:hypothetical protein [Clostridiales bacterium]